MTVTDDLWSDFRHIDETAFGYTPDVDAEALRGRLIELDRSLIGRLDGEWVGCGSIYSLDMSVPGGVTVPTAGITWISVLPTHRRRGILTALMRRQFDDIRGAGREPIAALWAAEPAIYPRFGFGPATWRVSATVPRHAPALLRAPAGDGLRTRLLEPSRDLDVVHRVYEAVADSRPGIIARDHRWWDVSRLDVPNERKGASALRTLVVTRDGEPRGYARHRVNPDWSSDFADGTLQVQEALALDADAAAVMWRTLLGTDLMGRTEAWNLMVDDPLLTWLPDLRRAGLKRMDALYLRLVDLPAALSARRYCVDVDVVLDVTDAYCPWNAGRWRLRGGPDGADCEPTPSTPDLTIDVTELGAAYLGGTSLSTLASGGFVREHRGGALAAASRAFWSEPQPWTAFVF